MKQKKLFILIVLVSGVWGMIGYRIYQWAMHEPAATKVQAIQTKEEVRPDMKLSLDYEDPFFERKQRIKPKPVKRKPVMQQKNEVVPQVQRTVNWSMVEYLGMTRNPSSGTTIATIKIGSREYFARERDVIDIFVVAAIHADSVLLKVDSSEKYVKLNKVIVNK